MNAYEMTVLLSDEKDIKEVKELIEGSKSKIKSEKSWGKRNLAYPINKESTAYYITLELEIDPTQVTELKKKLNFNEKMIRYLLLNKEE